MAKARSGKDGSDNGNGGLDKLYGDYAPYVITLQIRGVTPILFNRNDTYVEEDPGEAKRPRNTPIDYEELIWRDDTGQLAIPTANVIASIAHAGRYYKTPIGNTGSAKTTLQEAMMPVGDEYLSGFGVDEWDAIDYRIARYAGKSRAPKPTWRPRLEKGWQLQTRISVITPEIYSPSRLATIVATAGRVCGIGDGRKLGFGRYVTTGIETTEGITW